ALEAIRAEPPDVLLLDVEMPDQDGYELCRQLKADPRTAAVPIIFMSAHDAASERQRAFAAGGADYLAKPFEGQEVLRRLDTQRELRRLVRENERLLGRRCPACGHLEGGG